MDLLPTLITSGWASGVNAYLTVALINLLGRAGVGEVPDALQGDAVLAGALLFYAVEFVADKVPLVDSVWDLAHTVVRPAIGGALGYEYAAAEGYSQAEQIFSAGGTGALALVSHGVKAGFRLGVNSSPEPFTNIATSFAEDTAVAGVTVFSLYEPVAAAVIAGVLLVLGVVLVVFVWRRIRRGIEWVRKRMAQRRSRSAPPP